VKLKFNVIEHHPDDDPDCGGDYTDIEIVYSGVKIASYGDSYHDQGSEKVKGFIDGVRWMTGESPEVEYNDVADREI